MNVLDVLLVPSCLFSRVTTVCPLIGPLNSRRRRSIERPTESTGVVDLQRECRRLSSIRRRLPLAGMHRCQREVLMLEWYNAGSNHGLRLSCVCVDREFEGTTTAREAYTGAAGERAARIVRDSELTSGNRKAKFSVRIVRVVLDGGSCVRARFPDGCGCRRSLFFAERH